MAAVVPTALVPFEQCIHMTIDGKPLTNTHPHYDNLCELGGWKRVDCVIKKFSHFSVGRKDRNDVIIWEAKKPIIEETDGWIGKVPDPVKSWERTLYVDPRLPFKKESWVLFVEVCNVNTERTKKANGDLITQKTTKWHYVIAGEGITMSSDLKVEEFDPPEIKLLPEKKEDESEPGGHAVKVHQNGEPKPQAQPPREGEHDVTFV